MLIEIKIHLILFGTFNLYSFNKCEKVVNNSIQNQWQGLFWEKVEEANSEQVPNINQIKYRFKNDPTSIVRFIDKDQADSFFNNAALGGEYPVYL